MEESNGKGDLHGNFMRQNSNRSPGMLKIPIPARSSVRNSPSFRRLNSSRTPRRESKANLGRFLWIRNNRVVFWLILITLWAYIGFHVQSQWAHSDHSKPEFIGYKSQSEDAMKAAESLGSNISTSPIKEPLISKGNKSLDSEFGVSLVRKGRQVSSRQNSPRKKGRKRLRGLPVKPKAVAEENPSMEEVMIPRKNTSYGLIVGPFGKTEDSVLGWSPEKRKGTCDRKGEFARVVWSRRFLLVFHELSMTGAPLSMMELGTELLSCGGSVSAVVLSWKGGLMTELERRGFKVLKDRGEASFKTAMKVDLVIAGSAVCSSWIDPYLTKFPAASSQVVWWIMENRREYFDRSKHLLKQVKLLIFLSDLQSKQWLSWCEEEKIELYSQPMLVPLSVNDELAFVAGIPCSLNTPAFTVEKMIEKRDSLRNTVRREMGLDNNDMLVMSLSSINPAKGQRLLLEAALLVAAHNVSLKDPKSYGLMDEKELAGVTPQNRKSGQLNPESLLHATNQTEKKEDTFNKRNATLANSKKRKRKRSKSSTILSSANRIKTATQGEQRKFRRLLSEAVGRQEQSLKLLIGSIGSKSNKVLYVKTILRFLSQHSNLSNAVLWTPTTTRVASLYAAADVYVINAQGLGETFGRVTIEAMAFGLPVLGTDAGGTREIVDHSVTGLLHPLGHEGTEVLAQNIQYLLSNPLARKKMGMNGRLKVQDKYLKHHMYERFAKVLFKCLKPK